MPQPIPFRAPMAYPMALGDQELVNLVSECIELKKRDGTIDALYRSWVLGREAG